MSLKLITNKRKKSRAVPSGSSLISVMCARLQIIQTMPNKPNPRGVNLESSFFGVKTNSKIIHPAALSNNVA